MVGCSAGHPHGGENHFGEKAIIFHSPHGFGEIKDTIVQLLVPGRLDKIADQIRNHPGSQIPMQRGLLSSLIGHDYKSAPILSI
jgi:hypothetical protein